MQKHVAESSWFRRNWQRIIAAIGVAALIGSIVAIVWFNNSKAASLAVAAATSNQDLVARIGEPLRFGWRISGGIEESPGFGKAELAIPVSGPKGEGTLYAAAAKQAGIWRLTLLQFGAPDSMERLQLLK